MTLIQPLPQYNEQNETEERLRVQRELERRHKKGQHLEIGRTEDGSLGVIFTSASGVRLLIGLDASDNLAATNVETGASVTIVEYDDVNGTPSSLADLDAVADSRLNSVSAEVTFNRNLLPNSSALDGTLDKWTNTVVGGSLFAHDDPKNRGRGFLALHPSGTTTTGQFNSDLIDMAADVDVTLSGFVDFNNVTSGSAFQILLQCYDSGGTFISFAATETFFDDRFGAFTVSGTTPSGTASLRVTFVWGSVQPQSGTGSTFIYRLKLELGDTATRWTDNAGLDAISATASVLQEAFIASDGTAVAQIVLEAAAGGGNPARIGLRDGAGGSDIALAADQIFFGDNTVFEDTYNSFYTEADGDRNRFGGPFPASGDLLEWFGPDSVALNSETRTNGYFAKGTDGKVYYGNAELATGGGGQNAVISLSRSPYDDVNHQWQFTNMSIVGGVGPYTYTPSTSESGYSFNQGGTGNVSIQLVGPVASPGSIITVPFTVSVTDGAGDVYTQDFTAVSDRL